MKRETETSASAPPGPVRWLIVRLAIATASLLATLALGELGYRVWLASNGEAYDRGALTEELRRRVDTMEAFVPGGAKGGEEKARATAGGILNPFSGSELRPDTGDVLAHFRLRADPDEYTIVVVGGSLAASWARDLGGHFQAALEADPRFEGRNVRILGYAHAAYKQPQQLMRVAYLLSLGYRPDAVVNLDGFNELANALRYSKLDVHPLYPSYPLWGHPLSLRKQLDESVLEDMVEMRGLRVQAEALVERTLALGGASSSVVGRWILARLEQINARRAEIQAELEEFTSPTGVEGDEARELQGPPFDGDQDAVLELAARNWFESSLSLYAMCHERGIEYLHVLQPTLHDPGSKPKTKQEEALHPGPGTWKPAVVIGYPMLRELGLELQQHGVHFVDTSRCFEKVEETLYIDACHVGRKGEALLSAAVAAAFLQSIP